MNWYLTVVRDNYANFEGRARRSEFWYFVLINALISLVLYGLMFAFGFFGLLLYCLYTLAVLIPNLAVSVRRLHDIGKSGWFYLIFLIPLIGPIWLLILFFTEGDSGPNEYGADPKRPYEDINEIGTSETY